MFILNQRVLDGYKTRRIRWAGHVAETEETRISHYIFVSRPEGKRDTGWIGGQQAFMIFTRQAITGGRRKPPLPTARSPRR
jgi:hypothetical protein